MGQLSHSLYITISKPDPMSIVDDFGSLQSQLDQVTSEDVTGQVSKTCVSNVYKDTEPDSKIVNGNTPTQHSEDVITNQQATEISLLRNKLDTVNSDMEETLKNLNFELYLGIYSAIEFYNQV